MPRHSVEASSQPWGTAQVLIDDPKSELVDHPRSEELDIVQQLELPEADLTAHRLHRRLGCQTCPMPAASEHAAACSCHWMVRGPEWRTDRALEASRRRSRRPPPTRPPGRWRPLCPAAGGRLLPAAWRPALPRLVPPPPPPHPYRCANCRPPASCAAAAAFGCRGSAAPPRHRVPHLFPPHHRHLLPRCCSIASSTSQSAGCDRSGLQLHRG